MSTTSASIASRFGLDKTILRLRQAAAGARVEMLKDDWDKEQMRAEVQAHDDIMAATEMQNKLKNSRPQDHECDTNFYLQGFYDPRFVVDVLASGGATSSSQPASGGATSSSQPTSIPGIGTSLAGPMVGSCSVQVGARTGSARSWRSESC